MILLSICIPTYNRAEYLRKTLDSIVKQDYFINTNEIDIIISDNCSTDNTTDVSQEFIRLYGNKIKYFRNAININDLNFEKVLSEGTGAFLKLNNDTLIYRDGSLKIILNYIKHNIDSKNILFFANGVLKDTETILCENLNSFVKVGSYYSTWIGAFGMWKTDFEKITDFNRCSKLQLIQTDILFRMFQHNKKALIINEDLFISITPPVKGGYDLLTVFLDNYLFLLKEQLKVGNLEKKIFKYEKKRLLLDHICLWLLNAKLLPEKYNFTYKNSVKKIFFHYRTDIITMVLFWIKINLLYVKHIVTND